MMHWWPCPNSMCSRPIVLLLCDRGAVFKTGAKNAVGAFIYDLCGLAKDYSGDGGVAGSCAVTPRPHWHGHFAQRETEALMSAGCAFLACRFRRHKLQSLTDASVEGSRAG